MPASFLKNAMASAMRADPPNPLVPEINTMARNLVANHSSAALSLACLAHMTRGVLRHYGEINGRDIEPLLALQCDCIKAYMDAQGVTKEAVVAALGHLERASVTAGYLGRMPD